MPLSEPNHGTEPMLLPPGISAVELAGFLAFSYCLRELVDRIDAPLLIRALGMPLAEVVVVWILLRLRGLRLAAVGLRWREASWRDLGVALAAVAVVMAIYVYGRPVVASLVGEDLDLSAFARIRGNETLLALGIVQAVLIAGFREELLYRGFLMTRAAGVVQRSPARWTIALLTQTLIFGVAHAYQGPTGVVVAGAAGLVFGIVMLVSGKRLLPAMLAHAAVDTIAVVVIYLGVPVI